jgi:type VI secretion system protein ImpL
MMVYWVTGGILLLYLVLVWFIGTWLGLHGSDIWILRGGLWLIGLVGAVSFLWFYRKNKAAQGPAEGGAPDRSRSAEIDVLVHEAMRRLKASTLGHGATLGNLPLVFLVGEPGSTKTTTIIHSSLDPELLAGHVYQDNNILPTRVANIWYTREAIFLDPSSNLVALPELWKRLVTRVQRGKSTSAFGKGQQAPRAAVVCFDCANFLQPGASETTLAAARRLAVRLQEISQLLSISFPVYVLFTKADKISFFQEFAGSLSKEEASEVLGATLPARSLATGVYAEEETNRLTKAFDEIFYSLALKRLDLLGRAHEPDSLPGIYEFPRELRKLRALLVQFLVDLARPSQLTVNPFLRGFYFSGVRPVIVDDGIRVAPQEPVRDVQSDVDAGATRIFTGGRGAQIANAAAPRRAAGARKVPQWVFLTQLFNEVIVKDRFALSASGFSARVNLWRRVTLACLVLVVMVCAIGFLVSFLGNYDLEKRLQTATADLSTLQHASGGQASLADLQKLDNVRRELATLSNYQTNGVPLHLRWGLYIGFRIYPDARRIYFERFWSLLLDDTQARLLARLRSLPAKPRPGDTYGTAYDELKAYLITTTKHEKSTRDWLPRVLTDEWAQGRVASTDSVALAKAQFEFYSTELAIADPFASRPDDAAIEHARSYLRQFGGIDHIYKPMLDEVSRKFAEVNFNEQYPNSIGVVAGNHRVRGAFTKPGFTAMNEAIRNSSNYISAEDWVVGKMAASELDETTLQRKLNEQYHEDFIREWHTVLTTSRVTNFALPDAPDRLDQLTSATSPLLELFYFIAYNTDVGASDIAAVFAPVDAIEKPGSTDQPTILINSDNGAYVHALIKLQEDIGNFQKLPDQQHRSQALTSAGAAKSEAKSATSTHIDHRFNTEVPVRHLLEEPIVMVEDALTKGDVGPMNSAGQAFCQKFDRLRGSYPFKPSSPNDLPIDELSMIFAPGRGSLWTFYDDAKLSTYLTKEGPKYVINPSAPPGISISADFLNFFNRMAALSDALYPQGSPTPRFQYTLKELPSNVDGLVLKVGTETLSGTGQEKTFTWTGGDQDVVVMTKGGDTLDAHSGPWAVFRFVSDANSQVSGPVTELEWVVQINGHDVILPSGKKKSYMYELRVSGFNPFRAADLSSLSCKATVAK